jgi:hypothetical protein
MHHFGMAATPHLPPEIEDYQAMRETAEILADPSALKGLADAHESEQAGDVDYGTEAARALLAERKRLRS